MNQLLTDALAKIDAVLDEHGLPADTYDRLVMAAAELERVARDT